MSATEYTPAEDRARRRRNFLRTSGMVVSLPVAVAAGLWTYQNYPIVEAYVAGVISFVAIVIFFTCLSGLESHPDKIKEAEAEWERIRLRDAAWKAEQEAKTEATTAKYRDAAFKAFVDHSTTQFSRVDIFETKRGPVTVRWAMKPSLFAITSTIASALGTDNAALNDHARNHQADMDRISAKLREYFGINPDFDLAAAADSLGLVEHHVERSWRSDEKSSSLYDDLRRYAESGRSFDDFLAAHPEITDPAVIRRARNQFAQIQAEMLNGRSS